MKIDTIFLKESFKLGYEQSLPSRLKAARVLRLYEGKQYSEEQLAILGDRGQPAETFNIIKLFTNQLIGFYSTVYNTVKCEPTHPEHQVTASVLNDLVTYIETKNLYNAQADLIKLDLFISGLCCIYEDVIDTKKTDDYDRPIREITKEFVHSSELVLDPLSRKLDYSDARFIHRFKWIGKQEIEDLFDLKSTKNLEAYTNFLGIPEAENMFQYGSMPQYDRYFDSFLVVHSIIRDGKDYWSIHWVGDVILSKKKITYKEVKFPYTIVKLQNTIGPDYFGVFNDVEQSQNAINQALIQIQMLVNTNKVLVRNGAVEDLEEFTQAYNRVNAVIPVLDLTGIKVENMNGEIQQQYVIIDKAFDRIQRVLGVNDSFLGMAFASDSGRKVKLQQNATIMALRYIDTKLDLFYTLSGTNTVNLIKQFYKAEQITKIVSRDNAEKWLHINEPLRHPETGEPIYSEVINPEDGTQARDQYGNILIEPLNNPDTDLEFSDVTITVEAVNYNDEDEKNQLLLETTLNGQIGKSLLQVNPGGFMKVAAMTMKSTKSKYSFDIAAILEETAAMLQPQPEMQDQLGGSQANSNPKSQQLKLPNEG